MTIEFLSLSGWLPDQAEDDTVSLLIDGHILVDTGWNCARNLMRAHALEKVDTVLFTHIHHDHFMSLPSLLFYCLNGRHDMSGLSIYGPADTEDIVKRALHFLKTERFYADVSLPFVRELSEGDTLDFDGVHVDMIASHHAIDGLSYRFVNPESRARCVYSGDTAPYDELIPFAHGAEVLIHECSFGAWRDPSFANECGHSGAQDAARQALSARVGKLYLVHNSDPLHKEEALSAAREIFANTELPFIGQRIML